MLPRNGVYRSTDAEPSADPGRVVRSSRRSPSLVRIWTALLVLAAGMLYHPTFVNAKDITSFDIRWYVSNKVHDSSVPKRDRSLPCHPGKTALNRLRARALESNATSILRGMGAELLGAISDVSAIGGLKRVGSLAGLMKDMVASDTFQDFLKNRVEGYVKDKVGPKSTPKKMYADKLYEQKLKKLFTAVKRSRPQVLHRSVRHRLRQVCPRGTEIFQAILIPAELKLILKLDATNCCPSNAKITDAREYHALVTINLIPTSDGGLRLGSNRTEYSGSCCGFSRELCSSGCGRRILKPSPTPRPVPPRPEPLVECEDVDCAQLAKDIMRTHKEYEKAVAEADRDGRRTPDEMDMVGRLAGQLGNMAQVFKLCCRELNPSRTPKGFDAVLKYWYDRYMEEMRRRKDVRRQVGQAPSPRHEGRYPSHTPNQSYPRATPYGQPPQHVYGYPQQGYASRPGYAPQPGYAPPPGYTSNPMQVLVPLINMGLQFGLPNHHGGGCDGGP